MTKKNRTGSHRKCDTARYRKSRKRDLENREIKGEQLAKQEADRIHAEAEFKQRLQPRTDASVVCPLCNLPITEEDEKRNTSTVIVNHKRVKLHKICPGEEN